MSKSVFPLLAVCGALVSACPYDATAAGLTETDGGYWYGSPADGGVFIGIDDVDASARERLMPAPDEHTLCKLFIGDLAHRNDWPDGWAGTWIEDVEKILGPAKRNSKALDYEGGTLSYQWSNGGLGLQFERFGGGAECNGSLCQVAPGPEATGLGMRIFAAPYFLSGIQARSPLQFLNCWDWHFVQTLHVTCDVCEVPSDTQALQAEN